MRHDTLFKRHSTRAGVGNYFYPMTTLHLYVLLNGNISFKRANFNLIYCPSRAGCGPRTICYPFLLLRFLCQLKMILFVLFQASAGGNLGLILGFSCLSVLMAFINIIKRRCLKKTHLWSELQDNRTKPDNPAFSNRFERLSMHLEHK